MYVNCVEKSFLKVFINCVDKVFKDSPEEFDKTNPTSKTEYVTESEHTKILRHDAQNITRCPMYLFCWMKNYRMVVPIRESRLCIPWDRTSKNITNINGTTERLPFTGWSGSGNALYVPSSSPYSVKLIGGFLADN